MSTSLATSLLRRALFAQGRSALLASSIPSLSSRSYVVIPRAVKVPGKSSGSLSTKSGKSAASKITAADENLKSVLDVEIESVVQSEFYSKEFDIPAKFPFEIIDTPGDQTLTLTREFNGETIKATVFSTIEEDNFEDEEEEDEDEEEDENEEEDDMGGKPSLTVVVSVQKTEGEPFLEFVCSHSEDGLLIESMLMKKGDGSDSDNTYNGPEFADLDEGLQDAVQKYLEVRGIRSSLFNFLNEYMMNKQEREYVGWLKNMKSFVSK